MVAPSDQTAIWPPLPEVMASALIRLAPSMAVLWALASGPAPWKLPPMATRPPPARPEALMVAPASLTVLPVTLTVPPVWPAPVPEASSVPPTTTSPPIKRMTPLRFSMLWAWMMPVLLTALCSRLPAAWAVSSTWPPSAWIRPPLRTRALTAP